VTLEVKAKSRMRWVCFRFDARPPNERVFMLGRWIEKQQARVDLGPETLLYSFAVEKLAEYTAQRDALLAEMGGRPTPFLL
jgi:hypothetical protein